MSPFYEKGCCLCVLIAAQMLADAIMALCPAENEHLTPYPNTLYSALKSAIVYLPVEPERLPSGA